MRFETLFKASRHVLSKGRVPQHHFDPNLVVSTILHGPAKVLKQSFLSGLRNGDEGGTHAGNLTSGVAAAGATSFACNLLAIYLSTFLAWPACESDAATTTTMRLGGTKSRVAAERAYFRLIETASRYVTQNRAVCMVSYIFTQALVTLRCKINQFHTVV